MKAIILVLIISLNVYSGFSQKTNDRKGSYNIKDYFLLLPDSVFKDTETSLSSEQRQIALKYKTLEQLWKHKGFWQIDTLDYRNGYMKISTTGGGGGFYIEITYFIKRDKTRLIAVNISQWDMMRTASDLKFFTYKNKKWKDVTSTVLPEITLSYLVKSNYVKFFNIKENNPLIYILPQKGKNIIVQIDKGAVESLIDDGKITEDGYAKIEKTLKDGVLYWHNGTFSFTK